MCCPLLLQGRYEDYVFEKEPLNKPSQGSTFAVYQGRHTLSGTRVVAKVMPGIDDPDTLQYAKEEVNLNFSVRQYDWMPMAPFLAWLTHDGQFFLICRLVEGRVASKEVSLATWQVLATGQGQLLQCHASDTQQCIVKITAVVALLLQVLGSADVAQREKWFFTLAFALACCHLNGVFHKDVADMLSNPTVNAMITSAQPLVLIHLGDAEKPTSDEAGKEALLQDVRGLTTFAEGYLFPGEMSDAVQAFLDKLGSTCTTLSDCKKCFYCKLTPSYPFPPGFAGMLQVVQFQ